MADSINSTIVISASISGQCGVSSQLFDNTITILGNLIGNATVVGSISSPIPISASISGRYLDKITGTISKSITINASLSGNQNFGFIGPSPLNPNLAYIPITAGANNRATSYFPDGSPIPVDYRYGDITGVIPISTTMLGGMPGLFGALSGQVKINANISGVVSSFLGTINQEIQIKPFIYDAEYGVSVSKTNVHAIVKTKSFNGIDIVKISPSVLISQADNSEMVSKIVAYAVLGPEEAVAYDYYYGGLFFQ